MGSNRIRWARKAEIDWWMDGCRDEIKFSVLHCTYQIGCTTRLYYKAYRKSQNINVYITYKIQSQSHQWNRLVDDLSKPHIWVLIFNSDRKKREENKKNNENKYFMQAIFCSRAYFIDYNFVAGLFVRRYKSMGASAIHIIIICGLIIVIMHNFCSNGNKVLWRQRVWKRFCSVRYGRYALYAIWFSGEM